LEVTVGDGRDGVVALVYDDSEGALNYLFGEESDGV
jgi:hypothetical protein